MHELDGVDAIDIARALSLKKSTVHARLDKRRKELAAAVRAIWDGTFDEPSRPLGRSGAKGVLETTFLRPRDAA